MAICLRHVKTIVRDHRFQGKTYPVIDSPVHGEIVQVTTLCDIKFISYIRFCKYL